MHFPKILTSLAGATLVATMALAATGTAHAADAVPAAPRACGAHDVAAADARDFPGKALVSVASYNIEAQYANGTFTNWPKRRNGVAANVVRCMPDVLGVQEDSTTYVFENASDWKNRNSGSTYLMRRSIVQFEDFIDTINTQLAGYSDLYGPTSTSSTYCWTTNRDHLPEWDGTWNGQPAPWRVCTPTSSNSDDTRLVYNMTTTTMVDHGFSQVSASSTSPKRYLTWGVFEQKATGRRYIVSTTHLSGGGADTTSDKRRTAEAKKIVSALATLHKKYGHLPTFTVGDFDVSKFANHEIATDVMAASYTDILGNDHGKRKGGRGSCKRLRPPATGVPVAATSGVAHPSTRFINPEYPTTNHHADGSYNVIKCAYPNGDTSKKVLASSQWWKYDGNNTDYIFASAGVRARTWETVLDPKVSKGVPGYATTPPSDHNMIMTYAYL